MSDDLVSQFRVGTPEVAHEAQTYADALRRFLDHAAAMGSDAARTAAIVRDLDVLSNRLAEGAASEENSLWRKAHRNRPPALLPSLDFVEDGVRLDGSVTFGRFHVGRHAAHGGAIALVFDEVMGALAGSGSRTRTRTAFLHVDYRAITPIDRRLSVHAWFDAEEGRKRFLRAKLSDGDVVCAEAHGLWIALRPWQP